MPHFHSLRAIFASVVLATSLGASPGWSQAPTPPSAPADATKPVLLPLVDFRDVALGEAVDYLRAKTGLNIIIPKSAETLRGPRMKLKNVTALAVLAALVEGNPDLLIHKVQGDPGTSDIYSLTPEPEGALSFTGEVPADSPTRKSILPSLDLVDANLGDFVEFLGIKSGVNIVVPAETATLTLPTLRLRNVSVYGALKAAFAGSEWNLDVVAIKTPEPGAVEILRIVSRASGGHPVNLPNDTKILRVYSLASFLKNAGATPAEESMALLDDAVRKAVTIARRNRGLDESSLPEIRSHEGTKLLLVSGSKTDVDVVEQVVLALGGVAAPGPAQPKPGAPVPAPEPK